MSLGSIVRRVRGRLAAWRRMANPSDSRLGEKVETSPGGVVYLPPEPYVFECSDCGKVFEARRRRPLCPECDGSAVVLMSE